MRKKKKVVSPAQATQRELSWLLYITEGYIANVNHALAINAYTTSPRALRVMARAMKAAEGTARDTRLELDRMAAKNKAR